MNVDESNLRDAGLQHGRTTRGADNKTHPWVESVYPLTSRSTTFVLRNGLRIIAHRRGDPNNRYMVLDSDREAPVGRTRSFKAAMRIALEHRMYAQPLVVPMRQDALSIQSATLYPGSNSSQYYWQSADGKVALIRNRAEAHWWALVDGQLVEDEEATEREKALRPTLHCIVLTAPTAKELAQRLARLHLHVQFDLGRAWRNDRLQDFAP